jgi:uncharacterized protein (DUF433 family)
MRTGGALLISGEETAMAVEMELPAVEPVPLREEPDGTVRVGRTRVTLDILIGAYKLGHSAEEIADWYSTLDVADIHAVIAYYLRHPERIDAYLERREREAAEIGREIEAICPPDGFREKLLARWAEKQKS